MTTTRTRPVAHGEAVMLSADDVGELLWGRGHIRGRHPVLNHQEDELRDKVRSKMAMATFLAGFVFTALSAALVLDRDVWAWHRIIAITALIGSLILLVASVYMFDQLGTPV
jgi:hypothetical protein